MGEGLSPVEQLSGARTTASTVGLTIVPTAGLGLFADFVPPEIVIPIDRADAFERMAHTVRKWFLMTTRERYAVDYLPYSDDFNELADRLTLDHDDALQILREKWPTEQYKALIFRFVQRLRKAKQLAKNDSGARTRVAPRIPLSAAEKRTIYSRLQGDRSEADRLPYTAGFDHLLRCINAERELGGIKKLRTHEFWCAVMRLAKSKRWRKPKSDELFQDQQ
jgi:hypothetical protein